MKHFYEEPEILLEKFDLSEAIAINVWGDSAPEIGEDGDSEDFGGF